MMSKFTVPDGFFAKALLVAFLSVLVSKPAARVWDDLTTPQPWFAARWSIPNHPPGTDPEVEYSRIINRPVHGMWSAALFARAGGDRRVICARSAYASYRPSMSGTLIEPLSTFLGGRCDGQQPGRYQACTSYDLYDEMGTFRSFGPFCGSFRVTGP